MADFKTLADRIREEAGQAARPGQMARLEAMAEEVEALRRGAKTLGQTIEWQGRAVLDATGMHNAIGEDGDGDWGAVWESLYDIGPKALREAAAALGHIYQADSAGVTAAIRFLNERAATIAAPPTPAADESGAPCLGDHAGPCFDGRPDLCRDILRADESGAGA